MFEALVEYIKTHFNLDDFVDHGRYQVLVYADGRGNRVEVHEFDRKPQEVRRDGEVIYFKEINYE